MIGVGTGGFVSAGFEEDDDELEDGLAADEEEEDGLAEDEEEEDGLAAEDDDGLAAGSEGIV